MISVGSIDKDAQKPAMTVHDALLELLQALGFPKQGGVCHGFTIRWLEANFLGEKDEKRFENRIKQMVTDSKTLANNITAH